MLQVSVTFCENDSPPLVQDTTAERTGSSRQRKKEKCSISFRRHQSVLLCAARSLRMLSSSIYGGCVPELASSMSSQQQQQQQQGQETERGRGLAGARTTGVFRVVNFELFARPVSPPHLPRAAV